MLPTKPFHLDLTPARFLILQRLFQGLIHEVPLCYCILISEE